MVVCGETAMRYSLLLEEAMGRFGDQRSPHGKITPSFWPGNSQVPVSDQTSGPLTAGLRLPQGFCPQGDELTGTHGYQGANTAMKHKVHGLHLEILCAPTQLQ